MFLQVNPLLCCSRIMLFVLFGTVLSRSICLRSQMSEKPARQWRRTLAREPLFSSSAHLESSVERKERRATTNVTSGSWSGANSEGFPVKTIINWRAQLVDQLCAATRTVALTVSGFGAGWMSEPPNGRVGAPLRALLVRSFASVWMPGGCRQ